MMPLLESVWLLLTSLEEISRPKNVLQAQQIKEVIVKSLCFVTVLYDHASQETSRSRGMSRQEDQADQTSKITFRAWYPTTLTDHYSILNKSGTKQHKQISCVFAFNNSKLVR